MVSSSYLFFKHFINKTKNIENNKTDTKGLKITRKCDTVIYKGGYISTVNKHTKVNTNTFLVSGKANKKY